MTTPNLSLQELFVAGDQMIQGHVRKAKPLQTSKNVDEYPLHAPGPCRGLTERDGGQDALLILGIDCCSHVRGDEPGGNRIACDVACGKLPGHSLCEPDDSSLRPALPRVAHNTSSTCYSASRMCGQIHHSRRNIEGCQAAHWMQRKRWGIRQSSNWRCHLGCTVICLASVTSNTHN